MRKWTRAWAIALALGIAALLASPALAGGWAVVTLDALPDEVRAGTPIQFGFMVRQHGVTPVDDNMFEGGPLHPYLSATNSATGETVRADAYKAEGDTVVGHFVVDVTFPSDGTWTWEIVPPPFQGTQMPPLTVLPPARAATSAPVTAALPVSPLTLTGVALLLVALGLALYSRRGVPARRAAEA